MAVTAAERAINFKGRMMTLTVLEVADTDLDRIRQTLDEQIERSPGFFQSMPLLLDLPRGSGPELAPLVELLRERGLVPLALHEPDAAQSQAARQAGLGVLSGKAPAREKAEPVPARSGTRIVDRPVRSGQQIYAKGGDLVVTAAVSEGAEVLADGSIHVYGPLRGKALAGASGDDGARIFCRRFEADLIAIAGCYMVADAIDEKVRGKAVEVRLSGDSLDIALQQE